jgi:hypothetical protein
MRHKVEVYTEHDPLHDRILDENADDEIAGRKRRWTLTMEFGTDALRDAMAALVASKGST